MQNYIKGVGKLSRNLPLKFWDPLHISGTVGARNVKFGRQIDHRGANERNVKLGQRGREEIRGPDF